MDGIAVNIIMLLLKGIPEGFLATLALHVFTRTKIDIKKYLYLSFTYVAATYLIRLLPITIGVNTVLSFFVLILIFQLAYKAQLSKVIGAIASSAVILILIAISEVLNMLLLTLMYGQDTATQLFNSSDGLTQSLSTIPSTVFYGIFVFAGYFIIKQYDKRKQKHGDVGKKTGK